VKGRTTIVIDDTFKLLLAGLPQGVLLGLIWFLYNAWTTLTLRRGFFG